MIATRRNLQSTILSDSQRYRTGGGKVFLKNLMIPGFRYTFFLRICSYFSLKNRILYKLFYIFLRHYKYKYGFEIHPSTKIGAGFYIGHFGGVVINSKAIIGCNVNISQGVTIGSINRGRKEGFPTIGNNVYIGPGAKILGNIRIGNNVAIGANSVVLDDIPDDCSVGGIPAKIISHIGAGPEYIQNPIDVTSYETRK